jgi:hypothetical protein
MHPQAVRAVARHLNRIRLDLPKTRRWRVLDLGGADVNGTVHGIVRLAAPGVDIDVLDLTPGPGVTIVDDATTFDPEGRTWDLVITTETLEHADPWPSIISTAARCAPALIGTAAGPGRPAHGARGDARPAPGEHYANVDPDELANAIAYAGYTRYGVTFEVDPQPSPTTHDVQWWALA